MSEKLKTTRSKTPAKVSAKAKKVVAPVAIVEKHSMTAEEELAAMKEQVKLNMVNLLKMAKQLGVDLEEIYEKPPVENTVIEAAKAAATVAIEKTIEIMTKSGRNITLADLGGPAANVSKDYRPGEALPGGAWRPWTVRDLDPNATTTFVPAPVPSLVYPVTDAEGRQKIKIDINDLVCWMTVGEQQTVNTMF